MATEPAAQLSISVATGTSYATRLLVKVDARDRVHLVIVAYAAGLVRAHR
jgi:DNA-binding NarL/FixJ family response regulator